MSAAAVAMESPERVAAGTALAAQSEADLEAEEASADRGWPGFVGLMRQRYFARIWWSQMFSQLGDWFSFVALLALVLELTGSGLHVSLVFLATAVPSLLLAPWAGVVADRFNRRRVLIIADVVRVLAIASLLLIRRPEQVWLVYVVQVVGVVANSFFSPCINAAIPQFVERRQLTLANTLLSATNGVVAALSAWLGGVVATLFSREACFAIDSLSFAVSALAILSIKVSFGGRGEAPSQAMGAQTSEPQNLETQSSELQSSGSQTSDTQAQNAADSNWLADISSCLRYAWERRTVRSLLLLKAGAGIGGGVMALLSVVPVQVYGAGDYGVGVLYGSRGLGVVLGAVGANLAASWSVERRLRAVASGVLIMGLFCLAFGWAPALYLGAAAVGGAFWGMGVQWVLTAALLQQEVDDAYLGRVFALDNFAMTCTASVAALLSGLALECWPPSYVAWAVGGIITAVGSGWLLSSKHQAPT